MSEKEPETGTKEWEAKREREVRELREKERSKAAEYRQKKQAGGLPETPTLTKITEEALRARYRDPDAIGRGGKLLRYGGILLGIFGFVLMSDEVGYVMHGYRFADVFHLWGILVLVPLAAVFLIILGFVSMRQR